MKVSGKIYIHAFFDAQGKFQSWSLQPYKMEKHAGEYGMFVFMHIAEVEIDIPYDVNDAALAAAQGIDALIEEKAREAREFTRKMMTMRNGLLALPMPDIIDADPK